MSRGRRGATFARRARGGERVLDFHAPVLENFRAPGKEEKEPEERKFGAHHQAGIVQDSATRFEGLELDLSGLQSYDDLPGFEEVSALSEAQLQERMIILLTCLRALGCSDLHLSAGSQPFVRRMLGIGADQRLCADRGGCAAGSTWHWFPPNAAGSSRRRWTSTSRWRSVRTVSGSA